MQVLNYTELRQNLSENLNQVSENDDIIIVSRGKNKNVVIIALNEYNALLETIYLTTSKKNIERLEHSIEEIEQGKVLTKKLREE